MSDGNYMGLGREGEGEGFDGLRLEYDRMFDALLAEQGFLAKKAMASQRESVWRLFQRSMRGFYTDAMNWRRHYHLGKDVQ